MATRPRWEVTALLHTDMRRENTGETPEQLMSHNAVTIQCAVTPSSNEQTCCLFFPALEQMISMEKAEGLLCSLAHHWHVPVLLYYSLVCCSTQTAIQLPCKLLWLNVLPSTLVSERFFFFFFFGKKGSHLVYFFWTRLSQFKWADTNSLWHMVIRRGNKSHLKKQDIMDEKWRILLFCSVFVHVSVLWHTQGNTSWSCFWLRLSSTTSFAASGLAI